MGKKKMGNERIVIGEEQLKLLRSKSPYVLPDNPSDKGFSAAQIKAKMYEGLLYLFHLLSESHAGTGQELDQLEGAISELSEDLKAEASSLKAEIGSVVASLKKTSVPYKGAIMDLDLGTRKATASSFVSSAGDVCVTYGPGKVTVNIAGASYELSFPAESGEIATKSYVDGKKSESDAEVSELSAALSSEISKIKTGATAVGKAKADQDGLGFGNYLKKSEIGVSVPSLGEDGKVPPSQLPSYVDDVLEFPDFESFPETGESGKIYVSVADRKTYRWGGTAYAEISPQIALGTTSGTAYPGNKGKELEDRTEHLESGASQLGEEIEEVDAKVDAFIASYDSKPKVNDLGGGRLLITYNDYVGDLGDGRISLEIE